MKTIELKGKALNHAVHQALGWRPFHIHTDEDWVQAKFKRQAEELPATLPPHALWRGPVPDYVHDWGSAADLLGQFKVQTVEITDGYRAWIPQAGVQALGETMLEAVCRCVVLHRMGRNVDVPKELKP